MLTVSQEGVNTEPIEEVLPGGYSLFNLDPKVTKIFVGGIPAGIEVDGSILSTSFDGEIEDLHLNDQFIGLWNFMSNGTNNNYQRGALERWVRLPYTSLSKNYLNIFVYLLTTSFLILNSCYKMNYMIFFMDIYLF